MGGFYRVKRSEPLFDPASRASVSTSRSVVDHCLCRVEPRWVALAQLSYQKRANVNSKVTFEREDGLKRQLERRKLGKSILWAV